MAVAAPHLGLIEQLRSDPWTPILFPGASQGAVRRGSAVGYYADPQLLKFNVQNVYERDVTHSSSPGLREWVEEHTRTRFEIPSNFSIRVRIQSFIPSVVVIFINKVVYVATLPTSGSHGSDRSGSNKSPDTRTWARDGRSKWTYIPT